MVYKRAIVTMDSGKQFILADRPLKELCDLLETEEDIRNREPIFFNEEGITIDIIYPNHISHIHFER